MVAGQHQLQKLMLKWWHTSPRSSSHCFGHLVDEASYKVLDEIANVEVGTQDKPLEEVVIETIEVTD